MKDANLCYLLKTDKSYYRILMLVAHVLIVLFAPFGAAKTCRPTCSIKSPYNITACVGTNVTIRCILDGKSEWLNNSHVVPISPRHILDKSCSITIQNVSLDDAGEYTHEVVPENGPTERSAGAVYLHVVDCTGGTPSASTADMDSREYQEPIKKIIKTRDNKNEDQSPCTVPHTIGLLFAGIVVGVLLSINVAFLVVRCDRVPVRLINTFHKVFFERIKCWVSKNCPEIDYFISIDNDSYGKFIFKVKDPDEVTPIQQRLSNTGFSGRIWRVEVYEPGADRNESEDSSPNSINEVKLLPLRPIKCGDRISLFSGTLSTRLGERFGIMSGHAALKDGLCKTNDGKLIGKCIFTVDEIKSLSGMKAAIDLALVRLEDDCVVENVVILKGRPHRLRIAKEMVRKGQEVFMMDSNKKLYHGIVHVVRISDGCRLGAMGVTDTTGRSHILNCGHSGNSGSLIMSLSDSERDTANVHGIFTSRYTYGDEFGAKTMDVGIHLGDALKFICQTRIFEGVFESKDTELFEYAADNSAQITKQSSSYSFAEAFLCKRRSLVENIDVSHGFLLQLLDRKLITSPEVMHINSFHTEHQRVEMLIDVLEKCPSSQFEEFCEALNETNQRHIVRLLNDEIGLNEFSAQFSHKELLRDRTEEIVRKFRVNNSHVFWEQLTDREIFTRTQVNDCLYQQSPELTANTVIEVLRRCEKCTFDRFVETLKEYHGDEMANLFCLPAENALHSDKTFGELPTSVAQSWKDNVRPIVECVGETIFHSLGLSRIWGLVRTVDTFFGAAPKMNDRPNRAVELL